MTTLYIPVLNPEQQFFDADGVPLAGGFVHTYEAGSSTAHAAYSDNAGTPHANPIELDSEGRAVIYLASTLLYKFVVTDAAAMVLYTQDNVGLPAFVEGDLVGTTDHQQLSNKTLDNTTI